MLWVCSIASHFTKFSKSLRLLFFLLLWTLPTFLLSLLSFLVDILLFAPYLDWSGWVTLALTVLIAISGASLCIMRRSTSSRLAMDHKNSLINSQNNRYLLHGFEFDDQSNNSSDNLIHKQSIESFIPSPKQFLSVNNLLRPMDTVTETITNNSRGNKQQSPILPPPSEYSMDPDSQPRTPYPQNQLPDLNLPSDDKYSYATAPESIPPPLPFPVITLTQQNHDPVVSKKLNTIKENLDASFPHRPMITGYGTTSESDLALSRIKGSDHSMSDVISSGEAMEINLSKNRYTLFQPNITDHTARGNFNDYSTDYDSGKNSVDNNTTITTTNITRPKINLNVSPTLPLTPHKSGFLSSTANESLKSPEQKTDVHRVITQIQNKHAEGSVISGMDDDDDEPVVKVYMNNYGSSKESSKVSIAYNSSRITNAHA